MPTLAELVNRVRSLLDATASGRVVVGLTGSPAAGKSTLAEALTAALQRELGASAATYVPMDGYHLSNAQLEAQGLRDRKGAPETFDGWGFLALLRRIRDDVENPIYAPGFARTVDEGVAATHRVDPAARVVVTEGNYLLLPQAPWTQVADLLTETWFCRAPADERQRRLVDRHVLGGRSEPAARAWIRTVDDPNADLVETTAARADLVLDPLDPADLVDLVDPGR